LRSAIRRFYRSEQVGICSYCRGQVSISSAANCHVEHIVPKSLYIDFIFEEKNFCVICADCNTIKRDQETTGDVPDTVVNGKKRKQYPRSSNAFHIVHPHFDNWNDHIELFEVFYVDKTAKGHFTIGACVLNRRLREFGWEKEITDYVQFTELATKLLDSKNPIEQMDVLKKFRRLLISI